MPWTVATLADAYRLTAEEPLIAAALADAEFNERRWLGPRANGGQATYTWVLRWPMDWAHRSLGLPAQAERLISIESTHGNTDGAYLSGDGWTIRRPTWAYFYGGRINAVVQLLDDTAHRDALVASLALETIGMPMPTRGRGWKRLLQDLRPPGGLPGRLPDEREITMPGTPAPPRTIYVGLAATADAGVTLGGLTAETDGTFRLPMWTGREHIIFVRAAALPITSINIGGIDQIAVFRQMPLSEGGQDYTEWRSILPWRGDVAGGAPVVIT